MINFVIYGVRVAGAVLAPSYLGKQKEEFIWYLQHLEVFSEHSLQVQDSRPLSTYCSWPALLMAMNLTSGNM